MENIKHTPEQIKKSNQIMRMALFGGAILQSVVGFVILQIDKTDFNPEMLEEILPSVSILDLICLILFALACCEFIFALVFEKIIVHKSVASPEDYELSKSTCRKLISGSVFLAIVTAVFHFGLGLFTLNYTIFLFLVACMVMMFSALYYSLLAFEK